MNTLVILVGLLSPFVSEGNGLHEGVPSLEEKKPPWLVMVPEMMPLEDLKFGPVPLGDTLTKQIQEARTDLEKKRPEIEKYVTPEVIRDLSRWARPQMKAYAKVPSLEKVVWKPVGREGKQDRLVLESTIDTLPTHQRLVTRWLKVYLVFDTQSKEVVRVIVTIRGERLE